MRSYRQRQGIQIAASDESDELFRLMDVPNGNAALTAEVVEWRQLLQDAQLKIPAVQPGEKKEGWLGEVVDDAHEMKKERDDEVCHVVTE